MPSFFYCNMMTKPLVKGVCLVKTWVWKVNGCMFIHFATSKNKEKNLACCAISMTEDAVLNNLSIFCLMLSGCSRLVDRCLLIFYVVIWFSKINNTFLASTHLVWSLNNLWHPFHLAFIISRPFRWLSWWSIWHPIQWIECVKIKTRNHKLKNSTNIWETSWISNILLVD